MKALDTYLEPFGIDNLHFTGIMHIRGSRIAVTDDYEQIVRGQIVDALMTNSRERVMRPDYGCDIQSLLFDPSDALVRDDVASTVKERLGQLVPRARIQEVTFETAPGLVGISGVNTSGRNVLLISVKYSTRTVSGSLSVAIPIEELDNG